MYNEDSGASRREFLREVGTGVAGLWGISTLELSHDPRPMQSSCAPPGPLGTPVPFRRDCRPIRPRRAAAALSTTEVTQLKAAYQAMRALDASDPADPRGFTQQAHIHCYNCVDLGLVHGNWRFFAWHRAYLYFHERILGKLVGDENFRLPYWGWDSLQQRRLPSPYVTPNDASNPLFDGTRGMSPTDALPEEDVGATVMSGIFGIDNFPDFGGTAAFGGVPEGTPHGAVHVDVGGDMGTFETAGFDPVFYAHHSNVDKVWSDWNKAAASHTNPVDAAFLNLSFTFYDENKVWRSIKASQVLDHENRLRYVYDPYRFWDRFICLLWEVIQVDWRTARAISLSPALKRRLTETVNRQSPVRLHLEGLDLPQDRSAIYRIYMDREDAQADRGPDSPGYLGSTSVVLNDRANRHPGHGARKVILDVTQALPRLLQREGRLPLYLVERNAREARRVLPLTARDVFFSRGNPDRMR